MKTIFVTVYDGDVEKTILRSGVYAYLKASGHRIVLLIHGASRLEYYKKEFEEGNTKVELLPPDVTFAEDLWYHLSWNTVPTHSVALRIRTKLYRGGKLWRACFEWCAWALGHLRWWRAFLRFIYNRTPDDYGHALFQKYEPDILFAPNMFSPFDSRIMRTARQFRVPILTTAKSWDVLTTKAFTRVKADRLLVFNEFNRTEAIIYGDYAPEQITVTGFPQFDGYAKPPASSRRTEFFAEMGLDSSKRLVLMGIPGDWLTPYTHEILTELDKRIEEGAFKEPIQILARLHPKYPDSSEKHTYKHIILERPGTHLAKKREFSIDMGIANTYAWTFTDHDIEHLAESLYFCDLLINTASTLTLDASALDKPVVLIGYDGNHAPGRYDAIATIYERDHLRHVVDTGAAPLVKSHDELVAAIERFLADPNYLRKERDTLRANLLYKVDGGAAKRTAEAVLSMINK